MLRVYLLGALAGQPGSGALRSLSQTHANNSHADAACSSCTQGPEKSSLFLKAVKSGRSHTQPASSPGTQPPSRLQSGTGQPGLTVRRPFGLSAVVDPVFSLSVMARAERFLQGLPGSSARGGRPLLPHRGPRRGTGGRTPGIWSAGA